MRSKIYEVCEGFEPSVGRDDSARRFPPDSNGAPGSSRPTYIAFPRGRPFPLSITVCKEEKWYVSIHLMEVRGKCGQTRRADYSNSL